MSPSISALLKINFATRTTCRRDSCTRQKEQSDEDDKPHLWRLTCVWRVLFVSLTEKLKIFVGNLLCAEDHNEFKLDNESSIILRKRILVKKFYLSAWFPVVSENTSELPWWISTGHTECYWRWLCFSKVYLWLHCVKISMHCEELFDTVHV